MFKFGKKHLKEGLVDVANEMQEVDGRTESVAPLSCHLARNIPPLWLHTEVCQTIARGVRIEQSKGWDS